jgi:hypothetical protein
VESWTDEDWDADYAEFGYWTEGLYPLLSEGVGEHVWRERLQDHDRGTLRALAERLKVKAADDDSYVRQHRDAIIATVSRDEQAALTEFIDGAVEMTEWTIATCEHSLEALYALFSRLTAPRMKRKSGISPRPQKTRPGATRTRRRTRRRLLPRRVARGSGSTVATVAADYPVSGSDPLIPPSPEILQPGTAL